MAEGWTPEPEDRVAVASLRANESTFKRTNGHGSMAGKMVSWMMEEIGRGGEDIEDSEKFMMHFVSCVCVCVFSYVCVCNMICEIGLVIGLRSNFILNYYCSFQYIATIWRKPSYVYVYVYFGGSCSVYMLNRKLFRTL